MSTPMTEAEFAGKVEWEGGVIAAIEYGLESSALRPGELKDAWAGLETAYAGIEVDLQYVESLLEDLEEDES